MAAGEVEGCSLLELCGARETRKVQRHACPRFVHVYHPLTIALSESKHPGLGPNLPPSPCSLPSPSGRILFLPHQTHVPIKLLPLPLDDAHCLSPASGRPTLHGQRDLQGVTLSAGKLRITDYFGGLSLDFCRGNGKIVAKAGDLEKAPVSPGLPSLQGLHCQGHPAADR